jgi:uncharacterized protein YndB with AHSA1/START domain
MAASVINKSISIAASPQQVWQVFTDPLLSNQMGGEYITDWEKGSAIAWKLLNGNLVTRGEIVEIKEAGLLRHYLYHLEEDELLSTITYELKNDNGDTMLTATEEFHYEMNEEQFRDASDGWDAALQLVKKIAEEISA